MENLSEHKTAMVLGECIAAFSSKSAPSERATWTCCGRPLVSRSVATVTMPEKSRPEIPLGEFWGHRVNELGGETESRSGFGPFKSEIKLE
jgi:hypothetical protein